MRGRAAGSSLHSCGHVFNRASSDGDTPSMCHKGPTSLSGFGAFRIVPKTSKQEAVHHSHALFLLSMVLSPSLFLFSATLFFLCLNTRQISNTSCTTSSSNPSHRRACLVEVRVHFFISSPCMTYSMFYHY